MEHAQSCPILCNSMGFSPPGPSVRGILQKRILEWVAISFSWSSRPRDLTQVQHCRRILYHVSHQGNLRNGIAVFKESESCGGSRKHCINEWRGLLAQAGSRAEEAMAPGNRPQSLSGPGAVHAELATGKPVPHPGQQVTVTFWPGCLEAMDKYSAPLIHSQEAIVVCWCGWNLMCVSLGDSRKQQDLKPVPSWKRIIFQDI